MMAGRLYHHMCCDWEHQQGSVALRQSLSGIHTISLGPPMKSSVDVENGKTVSARSAPLSGGYHRTTHTHSFECLISFQHHLVTVSSSRPATPQLVQLPNARHSVVTSSSSGVLLVSAKGTPPDPHLIMASPNRPNQPGGSMVSPPFFAPHTLR